jgi:hypothetical protein
MSSRSLAAARARRSGENAPPVSGNRPGTSIGSHAAFSPPPNNVRVARSQGGAPQQPRTQPPSQQQQQQMQQQQQSLPFSKLSISDAIGLITLRLGRVEQWVIETQHEKDIETQDGVDSSKTIETSVLTSIMQRIDSLEQSFGTGGTIPSEQFSKITEEVTGLTEQLKRIGDETTKHTLAISKNTEQMLRFERDLVETKDILKTFMLKYDGFVTDINGKLEDYEAAISEIEKGLQVAEEQAQQLQLQQLQEQSQEEQQESTEKNTDNAAADDTETDDSGSDEAVTVTTDLKSILKKEVSINV